MSDYEARMHGEDGPEGSLPLDCPPTCPHEKIAVRYGDWDSFANLYEGEDLWHDYDPSLRL